MLGVLPKKHRSTLTNNLEVRGHYSNLCLNSML